MKLRALAVALFAFLYVLFFAQKASFAKTGSPETPEQIFKQVSPSLVVVHVSGDSDKPIALGSGVVVGHGEVITNCHVAEAGPRLEVSHLRKAYPATVRYADPDRDLCELSVPKLNAPPVMFGDSQHLEVGQRVYAVGAPEGLELSLSEGLISSVRAVAGLHFIQTTASISPGSSGGGLFDDHGHLVGITTFYVTGGQNLNFALPADWIHGLPQRAKTAAQSARSAEGEKTAWLLSAAARDAKSDWQGLARLCRRWVGAQPESPWAWDFLGWAFIELRQYEKAVEAYQQVVRLDATRPWAWWNLGFALAQLNQYSQAAEAYRHAVRLEPADAGAWTFLGMMYDRLHNYGDAVKAELTAVRIDPQNSTAWGALGIVYEDLDEYDKAAVADEMAVRLNPSDAISWGGLGLAYAKLREDQKAADALERAVALNPADAYDWFNLGLAYCGLGQRDKVIGTYRRLQMLDQERARKLFNACIAP